MARVKKIASDEEEEEEEERTDSPIKPVQSSDSDSADSEDDTQPSPMTPAFTIKPRDNVAAAATSKRKMITTSTPTGESSKKSKSAAGTSNSAKSPQRVWSEDDEISLLKGMVEFRDDNGTEPSGTAFFDFIKNYLNLNFELSRNQLVDKVYRLRKKYEANVEKAGNEEPVFAKPHDQNAFDLSKKIWGREAANNKKSTTSAKSKVSKAKSTATPSLPPLGITLALPKPDFNSKSKMKVNKVVKANGAVKAEVAVKAEENNNNNADAEKGKGDIWFELFLSSVVDVKNELKLPEFWDTFIKERVSVGDDTAKELANELILLHGKELELKLKKLDIQKKQYELALARLGASQ